MIKRSHHNLLCILAVLAVSALPTIPCFAQTETSPTPQLSVHWEELSASDFREGSHRSEGTFPLRCEILEKHGLHLPIGTDLLDVRHAALHAAEQEYAVVF